MQEQNQLSKTREIKRRFESEWLALDDVVAVGIGLTASGEMGVVISTKGNPAALKDKLPVSIENVPVEIKQIGEIRALGQ